MIVVGPRVAWWTKGSNGLIVSSIHNQRVAPMYGWNRTSCGRLIGEPVLHGRAAIRFADNRCKICERIVNKHGEEQPTEFGTARQEPKEQQESGRRSGQHLSADERVPDTGAHELPESDISGGHGAMPASQGSVSTDRPRAERSDMSNKSRRNRKRTSGDPTEVAARTGVAPAPGEVVSRKSRDLIVENRARAKMKAASAIAALGDEDYSAAGRLFKEASDASNLANAHKMRS